jgi:hypothetical protein
MARIDTVLVALIGICALAVACTSSNPDASSLSDSGSNDSGASDSGGEAATASTTADASPVTYGPCSWPASLNDGGPGACTVGRAYVTCSYPVGVTCEGGLGASGGQGGIEMGCISDDPTSCGCTSTSGAATCRNMCAPNEYAVSCGGPPHFDEDGSSNFAYQETPDGCVGVGATPGGNAYSCCPCQ